MADYGGAWAWQLENDSGINEHYVGRNIASDCWWDGDEDIPDTLIKEFFAWQAQFEGTDFYLPEPTAAASFSWKDFNQQGLDLSRKLKAVLGDSARVFYEKTSEESSFSQAPDKDTEVRREIMLDGRIVTRPFS